MDVDLLQRREAGLDRGHAAFDQELQHHSGGPFLGHLDPRAAVGLAHACDTPNGTDPREQIGRSTFHVDALKA